MKLCDTCGGPLADGHPFALCPKCLFGGAIKSHDAAGGPGALPLSPRRDFFEKYDLLEKVAGGGQGEVWKAWDFEFHRSVAMKRIAEESAADPPAVHRFLAEAQIASQLEHPGILPIFDVGVDPDGRLFYTTQLLAGETLGEVWRRIHSPAKTEWTVRRAVELLLRVCEVMGHAHSRGVIHRDLKPANILVGAFGDVRVVDWGSAHVLESARGNFEEAFGPVNSPAVETDRSRALADRPGSPLATASSGQPVTLIFTPPEILGGDLGAIGPTTDIYALGVMLYQLLTGQLPYLPAAANPPDRDELKRRIGRGPPPPVRSVNRRASRDLAAICEKAMAHHRAGRYPAMAGLAGDLRAALEMRPVQARRPGPGLRLQKWAQRNTALVLLAGGALLLLAVAFAAAHGFQAQRDAARQAALVRRAELAARSGRWRAALEDWRAADAAGYRDKVYLGLEEAEAWTILSEPEKSRAKLVELSRRGDLGALRGAVRLRLGEHEMFDEATANQGVADVRAALAAGLDPADDRFARGLLAEYTPEALDLFHQALQINSFHHGAHRHSLGLEFLLGRHADLQASLRFFSAVYPEDPSAGYLEAAELAMQGKLNEAKARMVSLHSQAGAPAGNRLDDSLPIFAAAAQRFDLDGLLTNSPPAMPRLDLFAAAELAAGLGGASSKPAPSANRMPFTPCLRKGPLAARTALNNLLLPFIGNADLATAQIKTAWQHHPEALVPMLAAVYLETRQPTNGAPSAHLLALQADLFQLAADSPSILGGLNRTARYLAAKTELALLQAHPTDRVAIRNACVRNLQFAGASAGASLPELKAYLDLAMKLGDYDSARELLYQIQKRQPEDTATLRARLDLESALGNWQAAWKLINQILAVSPNDARALADREAVQNNAAQFLEHIRQTHPQSTAPP